MKKELFIGVFIVGLISLPLLFNDVSAEPTSNSEWDFDIYGEPIIRLSNHDSKIFLTVPVIFYGEESRGTVYVNVHVTDGKGYEKKISQRVEDMKINETRNVPLEHISVQNFNPLTLKITLNPPPVSKDPEHKFDTFDEREIEFDSTSFIKTIEDSTIIELNDKVIIDPNINNLEFDYDALIIETIFSSERFEKIIFIHDGKNIYESNEEETTKKFIKSPDTDFENLSIELYYKKSILPEAHGQNPITGNGFEVKISTVPSPLGCTNNDCQELSDSNTIDEMWAYIIVAIIGSTLGIILLIISKPRYLVKNIQRINTINDKSKK